MISYYRIIVIIVILCVLGCVRDIKDLKDFPEDRVAVEIRKSAKRVEKQAIASMKKRYRVTQGNEIFDPWKPPIKIKNEKLYIALQYLPKDKYGYPDWQAAARKGLLNPINSIDEYFEKKNDPSLLREGSKAAEDAAEKYLNEISLDDVLFEINDRLMFNVRFSHKVHTYWLSCKICHPTIFKAKNGANQFTMYDIWKGEFCGRCHGKVAFPPKGYDNCRRCHSVGKENNGN